MIIDETSTEDVDISPQESEEFFRNERQLNKELDSNTFFNIIDDMYGIDYKKISRLIDGEVFTFNERHSFNVALRKIKKNYGIDLGDMILYLEETINLNKILKFLDEETHWVLKQELAYKNNIDINNKNIYDIIY